MYRRFHFCLLITLTACALQSGRGVAEENAQAASAYTALPVFDALSTAQWQRVDASINRALAWIARQQQPDGSVPTYISGQPAVTSLATMAFLSRGHRPGAGPYGKFLTRSIDYALAHQRPDGFFVVDATTYSVREWTLGTHTAMYNHAITGLMLGEVYGMTDVTREDKIRKAITEALAAARKMQRRPSPYPLDAYGWRYYEQLKVPNVRGGGKGEADLSVTGWYVMFYRSARNAEFDVPEQHVTEALQFVRNCYDKKSGGFLYGPYPEDHLLGRGMTGAGLLCLTLSGQHNDEIARTAGKWILDHPFNQYGVAAGNHDRFHYGAYYCSQAMFLLGGEPWRQFYPTMAKTLVDNQQPAGNWKPDGGQDGNFGEVYTTALSVLSLTPPYQLLPIYQR